MNPESQSHPSQSVPTGAAPALWNPTAAANLSVLFTPIFGAWIHARNWLALGREEEARKSMLWAYAGIALILACPFLPDDVGCGPNLFLLIAWYIAAARKQMKHVKENLANTYTRKGWGKPLCLGLIGWGIAVLVIAVIAR